MESITEVRYTSVNLHWKCKHSLLYAKSLQSPANTCSSIHEELGGYFRWSKMVLLGFVVHDCTIERLHTKKPSGNQSRQIISHPWDNNQWCPGDRISSRGFWWLQTAGAKAEWWGITQYICIYVCEMNKLFQTLGHYIFWLLQLRVCKTSAEHLSTLLSL